MLRNRFGKWGGGVGGRKDNKFSLSHVEPQVCERYPDLVARRHWGSGERGEWEAVILKSRAQNCSLKA